MESVLRNGLYYTIEFIKMLLVAQYVFRLEPKKRISYAYGASLAVVMLASYWFDFQYMHFTALFMIPEMLVLVLFLDGEKVLRNLIFAFFLINIADIAVANIVILFYAGLYQSISDYPLLSIALNSISLILFFLFLTLRRILRKGKLEVPENTGTVYLFGSFGMLLYISAYFYYNADVAEPLITRKVLIISQVMIIVFILFALIASSRRQLENERLRMQIEKNRELMHQQSRYYIKLSAKEEATKRFRHDMRAHILSMRQLYKSRSYKELGDYLAQLEDVWGELSLTIQTGNDIVNAILSDLAEHYPQVELKWSGKLNLNISQMDVSTIFYNLLKNAYEAASQTDHPWVEVDVRTQGESIIIEQRNPYREILQNGNGYQTTKQGEGHGYGLINLRECVEKNRGSYHADAKNGIFRTEIIFIM